jgi:hypothetical protein
MAELRQDSRVWKVGSRWSHDGNAGSCILDLFRQHHIVFVGHEHGHFSRIREGDLVIISSGTRVVALGRAMEAAKPFAETGVRFTPGEWPNVDPEDIGLACRISYQDLKEEDFVDYRIGAFHEVHEKAEHYRKLYGSYQAARQHDEFSIKARSCTLEHNASSPDDVLLGPACRYHIPIFQRPYSWGAAEVRRLLMDLLNAFEGRLGRAKREPMFIGTMQVSAARIVEEGRFTRCYDIIDGQQRMTTIALTLRAIQILGDTTSAGNIDWLSTSIGGNTQQGYLDQALNHPAPKETSDSQNHYLENLKRIISHLEEDDALASPADFTAFKDYLTSRVFFVVIETRAGLSKTLQIFDSINTSGMDLNGGDVFKIRYFEYLREHEGHEESIFETISDLYTKIDQRNKELGEQKIRMEGILDCAKWIVCERLDLPYQARELSGTTFFDRLFDTVLKIEKWDGFSYDKCMEVKLPTSLFDEVIEAATDWHRAWPALRPEAMAMDTFMWWSRYGNYHDPLVILFMWRFRPSREELEDFLITSGKLLLIYSLRFQKKTYEGRGVMHKVLGTICSEGATVDSLSSMILSSSADNASAVAELLTHDWLAHLPKSKNLVCRLVALLDELELKPNCGRTLCRLLFWEEEIDIEHIEAANHKDGSIRTEIQALWGQDLHGLGNLIVLERSLNRSISNEAYTSHKRGHYHNSRFASVKSFAAKHVDWSRQLAWERKAELTNRITLYLCGCSIFNPQTLPV